MPDNSHAPRTIAALTILSVALCAAGCSARQPLTATSILSDAILIDTHIDAPFRIERGGVAPGAGQFDIERAHAGGLSTAFMSIFVPATVDVAGGGVELADRLIDHVQQMVDAAPDRAGLATCVADVRAHKAAGRVGLALGMENGGPLARDDLALEHLVARGIRYVTLAHSKANAFADSSYDRERPWHGLSPAGMTMVKRLNGAGVMVDVSHLSDEAARDVLAASSVSVVATHSSARHFTPGFERNLDDALIGQIAAAGGVVQINFGSSFISAEARAWQTRFEEVMGRFLAETKAAFDSSEATTFRARYRDEHPYPRADLSVVLDHIDHVVALVGIEHVGFGSDFDGVGDTLPYGLEDVSKYPNLVTGLIERGYSQRDIAAVLGGNLLRVWQAAEDYAALHGRPAQCAL